MPASKRKSAQGKQPSSLVRKVTSRKGGQVKGGNTLSPSQQAQAKSNIRSTYDKAADQIIQKIR